MPGNDLAQQDKNWILHPFSRPKEEELLPVIVKGTGVWLYDEKGNRYLDASGSWWVNLHGHCHPYLNQKVMEQLQQLEHCIFSGFTHPQAVKLAGRLLQLPGGPSGKVFFSDNGSTAVEIALKLAWQYFKNRNEKRSCFLALEGAYHGDTLGAMAAGERDVFARPFDELLAPVHFLPIPGQETDWDTLSKQLDMWQPAAFIYEPLVQGAGGMRMHFSADLNRLLNLCKSKNILCIADEVFTGFGRTGTMLASEQTLAPDLMALSKGLTGGYLPLGATLLTAAIADAFFLSDVEKLFYHGHSYTANPLACAAANASLDLMEEDGTKKQMQWINGELKALKSAWNQEADMPAVRVLGNILAFDLPSRYDGYFYNDPARTDIYHWCLAHEVLMRPLGNVVYIVPPYCISSEELDYLLSTLEKLATTWIRKTFI